MYFLLILCSNYVIHSTFDIYFKVLKLVSFYRSYVGCDVKMKIWKVSDIFGHSRVCTK